MLAPAASDIWRQCLAGGSTAAQIELLAFWQVRTRQERAIEGRNTIENRRPVFSQNSADRLRRWPLAQQDCRRADRKRKTERVTEAVSEEQLGCREDDVAILNAENRFGVKLGCLNHARLRMNDAFGRAGGAGRVKPKASIVGPRRRGGKIFSRRRHEILEARMMKAVFSRHDDLF